MFDIGWTELVIIGVVALIVIGPRDLPEMFRTLGRFTAKLRSMAREFQRAMEQAADQSGVKDVAKDIKGMANPKSLGLDAVKDAAAKFEKWDPLKPQAKPAPKPPAPAPAPAATAPNVALGPGKAAERKALAEAAAEQVRAAEPAAPAAAEAPKSDA
jgi:sec-independent protein translocase protein TatB